MHRARRAAAAAAATTDNPDREIQPQRSPYTGIKGTHPDTYRDVHISQTHIAPYMGINTHIDGHKWT